MKTSLAAFIIGSSFLVGAADLALVVEIEEEDYTFTNANHGAEPMWCGGSTCLVRSNDHVFASGRGGVRQLRPPCSGGGKAGLCYRAG